MQIENSSNMIQRVQSIYLFLALITILLTFVFEFAKIKTPDGVYMYDIYGVYFEGKLLEQPNMNVFQLILGGITSVMTILTIGLFKSRNLQIKICRINFLLSVIFLVLVFVGEYEVINLAGEEAETTYLIGTFLPAATIAFLFLALRGIKKDEDLVKSLERLR